MAHGYAPWLAKIPQPFRLLVQIFVLVPLSFVLLFAIFGGAFSPIILLTWASVSYGERKHSALDQCTERAAGDGFTGSSDFYGMGIRLGIYLQWLASLVANAFLPGERRSMAGAYAGFALALLVAVLLLIFQDGCVYTAEMIILLNILWGGTYLVFLPYTYTSNDEQEDQEKKKQKTKKGFWEALKEALKKIKGLKLIIYPLFLSLVPITAWFWVRLASIGEVDFAPSPGGTSFLLFYKVRLSDSRSARVFMAFLCIWLVSTPAIALVMVSIMFIPGLRRLARFTVVLTARGFAEIVYAVFVWTFGFLVGWIGSYVALWCGKKKEFMRWLEKPELENILNQWAMTSMGLIIMVCSVLGTELTLKWNKVSGVYDVSSTGQVIPLATGLGILIRVIWKLTGGGTEEDSGQIETMVLPAAIQRPDGTWQ